MKQLLRALALASILVSVTGLPGGSSLAGDHVAYRVIVNARNPVESLTRIEVSAMFLKKTTKWANGALVVPTDQRASSSVRKKFSEEIHGKSVTEIERYWQQRVFSGRTTPPPQKRSDRSVVAFVQTVPGAIGYVSADAPIGTAKVIKLR